MASLILNVGTRKNKWSASSPGAFAGFVGPELMQVLGTLLWKRIQNYEYKIKYKSEYLFLAPHRALEGARATEGP